MLSNARSEDGFTLIELLAALVIGTIVMLAAFMVVDNAVQVNGRVAMRTEATQRGRTAIDDITRTLRSQVCVPTTVVVSATRTDYTQSKPIAAASGTSLTLTSDLKGGTEPVRTTFTYDPATDVISRSTIDGNTTDPLNTTFASTAVARQIIDTVDPVAGATAGSIFSYWAANAGSGGTVFTQLGAGGGSLVAADLPRIARVDVAFVARPASRNATTATDLSATVRDSVVTRSVYPDAPTQEATCP